MLKQLDRDVKLLNHFFEKPNDELWSPEELCPQELNDYLTHSRSSFWVLEEKTVKNMSSQAFDTSYSASIAPFYLGINHVKNPSSGKSWFKADATEGNKLNIVMKNMATKAELDSQRFINHSAGKRTV